MRTAVLILSALALAACETESYDSGQGRFSLTQADFVEAHSDAACAVDYAVTDGGDSLVLTERKTVGWIDRPDTAYRAILYYDGAGQGRARPLGISQVPVITVVPAERIDGIRTDPVKFESCWVSRTGKYLNVGLYLKVGEGGPADARHSIGMVRDSLTIGADGTRVSWLRLYHDQGGVPEYYSSRYYVSLSCASLDADSVCLSMNTYGGEVVRKLRIR